VNRKALISAVSIEQPTNTFIWWTIVSSRSPVRYRCVRAFVFHLRWSDYPVHGTYYSVAWHSAAAPRSPTTSIHEIFIYEYIACSSYRAIAGVRPSGEYSIG